MSATDKNDKTSQQWPTSTRGHYTDIWHVKEQWRPRVTHIGIKLTLDKTIKNNKMKTILFSAFYSTQLQSVDLASNRAFQIWPIMNYMLKSNH